MSNDDVAGYVLDAYSRMKTQRQSAEEAWLECWALYLGTPEAVKAQREFTLSTVGVVNNDWRHRINTGKAFEAIETVHGYLMSAFFPNSQWFTVKPQKPGLLELARVIARYQTMMYEGCNFKSHFAKFLRQLLITGNSVMALPWRYETRKEKKKVKVEKLTNEFLSFGDENTYTTKTETRIYKNAPEFEALDIFDCYVDGEASDANEAAFIRRITKTRFDVIQDIKRGHYSNIDEYEICSVDAIERDTNRKNELRSWMGININTPFSLNDKVELIEFWGDVVCEDEAHKDVVATVVGKKLVRFEPNPFWAGKPFVVGTCIALTQTPYAIGLLQANAGLLHQLNIITNQRLDNLELSIDEMYTYVDDGVLNPEDIYTEPGKVFVVGEHNSLRVMQRDTRNYTVTYQEASVLEQSIDRNIGTGALISANNARSGERVTAAEIQAVKDAGGNRLSSLQQHIEATALLHILRKTYRSIQQFVKEDEVIRVAGNETGSYSYIKLTPEDFQHDFDLKPVGTEYMTDRSRYVKDRLEFLQATASIPQMADKINYERILYDIVQQFGFDDPDSYLASTKPAQIQQEALPSNSAPEQVPTNEQPQTLEDAMYAIGGNSYKQAFDKRVATEGLDNIVKNDLGYEQVQQ